MSEDRIVFSEWEMREELMKLWQEAFGDGREETELFFGEYFKPSDCMVFLSGDTVASALYLLPCELSLAGEKKQAHYLYGAATRKNERSKGRMKKLLLAAAKAGELRGDRYSVLLPSKPSLYDYYRKSDYQSFFEKRCLTRPAEELPGKKLFAGIDPLLSYDKMCALRNTRIGENAVLWDELHLSYAARLLEKDGGALVRAKGAYAFCENKDGVCTVKELCADVHTLPGLLMKLRQSAPEAKKFVLELPVTSELFPEEGEIMPAGMIRALGQNPVPHEKGAYLGLALD